jgi:predicted NAD/FAD-dependent oxidoreductase
MICVTFKKRQTRNKAILTFLMLCLAPTRAVRPTVAVIGGGIAGLSCAEKLSQQYFDVTVFDTGRLRPGGRCASRWPGDRPKEGDPSLLSQYRFDHAAQAISVPPSFVKFQNQVKEWESRGVLRQFTNGSVYQINGAQPPTPLSSDHPLYFAPNGMNAIAMDLVASRKYTLQQDVWVSPSNGVKWIEKSQKWRVQAKGEVRGYFDYLTIAHNGKCADRLMSSSPAKEIHSLLRVNFAPTVPANGGNRMTLGSIYSLSFCLKSPSILSKTLPDSFVAGFISDNADLGFLTCQSRKLAQSDTAHEVWTILSTPTFAKRHKAPQEFMPEETIEEVSTLLLGSLGDLLNIAPESLVSKVVDRRLQLWGAAIPMNVWRSKDEGFLYDCKHKVGVCGDWLLEPSIAGAWTSGRQLADFMVEAQGDLKKDVGLQGRFVRSTSSHRLGITSASKAPECIKA